MVLVCCGTMCFCAKAITPTGFGFESLCTTHHSYGWGFTALCIMSRQLSFHFVSGECNNMASVNGCCVYGVIDTHSMSFCLCTHQTTVLNHSTQLGATVIGFTCAWSLSIKSSHPGTFTNEWFSSVSRGDKNTHKCQTKPLPPSFPAHSSDVFLS